MRAIAPLPPLHLRYPATCTGVESIKIRLLEPAFGLALFPPGRGGHDRNVMQTSFFFLCGRRVWSPPSCFCRVENTCVNSLLLAGAVTTATTSPPHPTPPIHSPTPCKTAGDFLAYLPLSLSTQGNMARQEEVCVGVGGEMGAEERAEGEICEH